MPYKKHVFICTKCSYREGETKIEGVGQDFFEMVKKSINKSELKKKGIRLSSSGCLGKCSMGVNAITYPEGRLISHLKSDKKSLLALTSELNS